VTPPPHHAVLACRVNMSLKDFNILGRIGDGSFSTVVLAQHKGTGKEYAIKIMNKHQIMRNKVVDYVRNERNILDKLDDAGVAKLHFTFQDPDSLCKS
jgi:3-phosphoinositide dependent protein kinase-1